MPKVTDLSPIALPGPSYFIGPRRGAYAQSVSGQMIIRPGWGSQKDTQLRSGRPTTNYGANTTMQLGYGSDVRRLLMEFTLPEPLTAANMTDAMLTLEVGQVWGSGALAAIASRCTRPLWTEMFATWNKFKLDDGPGDGDWTTAGGDVDVFMSGIPFNLRDTPGVLEISHSSLLEYCVDAIGERDRKLILLVQRTVESGSYHVNSFFSGDHEEDGIRPHLTIDYLAATSAVRSGRPPLQRAHYRNRQGRRMGSWRPSRIIVG